MNILALDTSMQACSVAILTTDASGGARMSACYEQRERGHAEHLMGMIDEALSKSGLSIKQMNQFAVCRGPGTFTGVRIGIAAARGLAMTCAKPLIGINTLQVMAARVRHEVKNQTNSPPADQNCNLGIAVDARRGEIYWQVFDQSGKAQTEPLALTPQTICELIKQHHAPLALAGSGVALISDVMGVQINKFACTHPDLQPDAARLAELVAGFEVDKDLSLQDASPLYLRPPDTKIQTGYAIERQ
ncbi:MAG: tRNA (adenosine(37)-N6)-threonylcarbamoyltransferase complex dimerization subunit type 1 TsaB [bacterium]|nr:tRNA (adenosine(37)-N6)-threonylcarbamoyltransferase complex dimerization subunit type 1 TsaB [bacterium]